VELVVSRKNENTLTEGKAASSGLSSRPDMPKELDPSFKEQVLRACVDWGFITLTALECLLGEHRSRIHRYLLELIKDNHLIAMGNTCRIPRTSPFKGKWFYKSRKSTCSYHSVLSRALRRPEQEDLRLGAAGLRGVPTISGLVVPLHHAATVVAASWISQILHAKCRFAFEIKSEFRLRIEARKREVGAGALSGSAAQGRRTAGPEILGAPDFQIFLQNGELPAIRVEVECHRKVESRYKALSEIFLRDGLPVLYLAFGDDLMRELVRRFRLNPLVYILGFGDIKGIGTYLRAYRLLH